MAARKQITRLANKVCKERGKSAHLLKKAHSGEIGVVYARTSSEGDKVERSAARQFNNGARAAKGLGRNIKVLQKVSEVISGSLPLQHRDTLMSLLSGKIPGTTTVDPRKLLVFVESARAVARDAMVGEQLYQASKASGVRIIPADMPGLFNHNPSPAENFIRKIMMSVQELDRDQIIQRCAAGLEAKKLTSTQLTQHGSVKVNGSRSILDAKPLTKQNLKSIKSSIKKYQSGMLALRPLAHEMGKVLRRNIHHETARRMVMEIVAKKL